MFLKFKSFNEKFLSIFNSGDNTDTEIFLASRFPILKYLFDCELVVLFERSFCSDLTLSVSR